MPMTKSPTFARFVARDHPADKLCENEESPRGQPRLPLDREYPGVDEESSAVVGAHEQLARNGSKMHPGTLLPLGQLTGDRRLEFDADDERRGDQRVGRMSGAWWPDRRTRTHTRPDTGAREWLPRGSDLSDIVVRVTRMTATEAARSFSELLNRVAAGEEIEVTRSGAPVAVIAPARGRTLSAEQFRRLLAEAPAVDPGFADDVRALRAELPVPADPWSS
jgi:prevent-host-death family protein